MRRFEEKVRDIVDVRSSASLSDFLADPGDTLAGYHFTDITSDLMAKWLDRVADVKKGSGAALALAGFRGVGKSHFLATLGAIVSRPELRSTITDQHVAATAQRLSRRHGIVAHVRRGSRETLIAEVRDAISEAIGARSDELAESIGDLMAVSAAKSGDLPPVIVIDTALGRETRVSRDDGLMLSDIAAAALELGIFVGIALDDDIAGADGINSSIASSFDIDYLDQEHLYKIVNAHVFAKNELQRPVLKEIYESYRASMPGFRWSESRFSSLYPLHPAILEIHAFVRLYLQDLPLLGFASEAGVKILGRPANSLIGLDEVFDSVEDRLRNVGGLSDAFLAYDSLDRSVVASSPVMQRHRAELVLKGLFLLSLTGESVSASELAAAMLIFDEHGSEAALLNVEAVFSAFATAMPGSIKVSGGAGHPKYLFKAGSEDDINAALDEAIAAVPPDVIWPILRRQTAEKFSDLAPFEQDPSVSAKCSVIWRGGIRRGEIVWAAPTDAHAGPADWRVFIASNAMPDAPASDSTHDKICEWRLGELHADDIDALRRFHVLQTDAEFRDKFRDSISTVLHVHLIAVEKIWQRVFLDEGYLVAGRTEYRFSEQARASHSLSHLFTIALDEYFASQFPSHPEFGDVLEERAVSRLVAHLFSGSAPAGVEIKQLAEDFAKPLGLVFEKDSAYGPLSAAELVELPIVRGILSATSVGKNGVLGIDDLSEEMRRPPYGLTREARHLVLAALVAQRQFEFVTANGNRINHRSLDLQIVWDDIIGLARPSEEAYSHEHLLKWAATLTGNKSLRSLKTADARLAVTDALFGWLAEWRSSALIEKFDRLPDDKLNTRLWRLATNVKKTFGGAAEAIDALLQNAVALDQCLQSVADAFSDSETEYEAKKADLGVLRDVFDNAAERDGIHAYLLNCEATDQPEIDSLRAELMQTMPGHFEDGGPVSEHVKQSWVWFKTLYADCYAERHAAVMTSADSRLDQFLATAEWVTFSDLSSIPLFGRLFMDDAMTIVREIRARQCAADVRDELSREPFCRCSFSLSNQSGADILIAELRATVEAGLTSFRQRLLDEKSAVDTAARAAKGTNGDMSADLFGLLEKSHGFPLLSGLHMQIVRTAARDIDKSDPRPADRRRATRSCRVSLGDDDIRELEDQLDRLGPA